jgi:hypothetical protein
MYCKPLCVWNSSWIVQLTNLFHSSHLLNLYALFGPSSFSARSQVHFLQLSYTRGTVIPCLLTLESDDPQALDLLSSMTSPTVRLQRCVKYEANGRPSHSRKNVVDDGMDGAQFVQSAVWWPSTRTEELSLNTRQLNGEIQLRADLKPSCAMAHFAIEVSSSLAILLFIQGVLVFSGCASISSYRLYIFKPGWPPCRSGPNRNSLAKWSSSHRVCASML